MSHTGNFIFFQITVLNINKWVWLNIKKTHNYKSVIQRYSEKELCLEYWENTFKEIWRNSFFGKHVNDSKNCKRILYACLIYDFQQTKNY